MNEQQGGQFVHEAVEVTTVHTNLAQEIIKITVDRLRLILQSHLQNMERRKEWVAPLGILFTMLVVFPTTEFKTFAGIKAEVWEAIFIISAFLMLGWLVKSAITALNSPTVEDVIEKIKRGG